MLPNVLYRPGSFPPPKPPGYIDPIDELPLARVRVAPKRKTVRHYPKTIMGGKCVRLVPCEVADRLGR